MIDRTKLLEIVRVEFHKHRFDYYQESVPGSRRQNTVPGCTICRTRLHTLGQFVDHLEEKVAAAIELEFSRSGDTASIHRIPVALSRISLGNSER